MWDDTQEWTSCEMYGHSFKDSQGERMNSCRDCGEPKGEKTVQINELKEGDVVVAVNGKPRPFPYTVTRVITTLGHTQVRYAHGGIIPPVDPSTVTATILV